MIDFHRPTRAEVFKANDVDDRERAIRLYCTSAGITWSLQIRSPVSLGNRREGKDFLIANASLSVDDMRALRDAIDALLIEY